MAAPAGVWLVELRFPPEGFVAPALAAVDPHATLESYLAALRAGAAPLPPGLRAPSLAAVSEGAARDAVAWFAACVGASVAFESDAHLVQYVHREADGAVVARYLFDAGYARAHPEALDREHLDLLHGTLAAKLFDDGLLVLDREGLAASLRWRSVRAKGTRLGRTGARTRGTKGR